MAPNGRGEPRADDAPLRRMKAVGLASLAVLAIAALTVAFTNASGTRSIAVDSSTLHWANVTSGAAAVTRASLNQAMIFAIDERVGVSSAEATELAIEEAAQSIDALDETTRRVPTPLLTIGRGAAGLVSDARAIVGSLTAGDTDAAVAYFQAQFEPRYGALTRLLAGAQEEYAARIRDAESGAARIEIAIRWLVTLLIPGLAVVLYRSIARRRYRRSEIEFEARLEAERDVSAAKDDFIAAVSHELRTPLTSIVGFSDVLLERGFEDPSEARELVKLIKADSEELTRMVEDLLAAPTVEGGGLALHPGRTDLRELAEETVRRMERGERAIGIRGNRVEVWADASRVRQIVRSLLSNADRYGREPISVEIGLSGEMGLLTVADEGPGVPEEIEERLFQPFVHESRETLLTGSIGLGLAIARALAKAMGGDITYERAADTTRFTVSLPALGDEGAPPADRAEAAHPTPVRAPLR